MSGNDQREGRARLTMKARKPMTAPPDLIAEIRLKYRLSKSAEKARITIDQKLASHALVYLTAWNPNADESERKKFKKQTARVVSAARKGRAPKPEDEAIFEIMVKMVKAMEPARETFELVRKEHHKAAGRLVKQLNIRMLQDYVTSVSGFSVWGLGTIIGEFGDLSDNIVPVEDREPDKRYSGKRRIYKRLGYAPNDSYQRGEKKTGRMIPRSTRGRIYGIVGVPLRNAKAKNAYGAVYDHNKARHLAAGKSKGHADKLAMRAMIKALIHDVHRAWHGLPPDYVFKGDEASQWCAESHSKRDRPSPDSDLHAAA